MRIGIDFDNTIAGYDHLFRALAAEKNWVASGDTGNKNAVRALVRALENGERKWQELQAEAYGTRMSEADLIEGVDHFLSKCREREIPVFIISHRTQYAARDKSGVDLLEAARAWMAAKGFFDPERFAVSSKSVYFESTRGEKIARIAALGCSHFIDDLTEVLLEESFPPGVRRCLLAADGDTRPDGRVEAFRNWWEIANVLIGP